MSTNKTVFEIECELGLRSCTIRGIAKELKFEPVIQDQKFYFTVEQVAAIWDSWIDKQEHRKRCGRPDHSIFYPGKF